MREHQSQGEHNYAVLQTDNSNQYQPLVNNSRSNCSIARSQDTVSMPTSPSYSAPLYHMLEKDISVRPGTLATANGHEACENEATYHVLDEEIISEPMYNVLEEENPADVGVNERSPQGRRQIDDPSSTEYLQPVQPMAESKIGLPSQSRRSQARPIIPVRQEPVYQMLEEECNGLPVYASTDYIDPNPVQDNLRSTIGRGKRVDPPVYPSASNTPGTGDTYQPLALPSRCNPSSDFNAASKGTPPATDNLYQPIITSDAAYMPILAENLRNQETANQTMPQDQSYQALDNMTSSDDIYEPLG